MEDHEKVIDALAHWPKVHRNTVHFRNNPNKYLLLTRPQVREVVHFVLCDVTCVLLVIRCWYLIHTHYQLPKAPLTLVRRKRKS